MSLSPTEFRKAMGAFATGVTIITVDLDGEVHGMTANALRFRVARSAAAAGLRGP